LHGIWLKRHIGFSPRKARIENQTIPSAVRLFRPGKDKRAGLMDLQDPL